MLTPRVTETAIRYGRQAPERTESDRPAPQPYHRPSQRETVRASLNAELHTHSYDREER